MLSALISITLRQWKVHKLRTTLTIISISLGVAVFFAVITANTTLLSSLHSTVEKMAGKATLQVTSGESGFPEEVLEQVRTTKGVKIAEPVIEVIAQTAFPDEGNIMIIGVDTAGDRELREYQFDESASDIGDPLVYIAQPDSILVSRKFLERHGLKEEDKIPLFTSQGRKEFTIRGVFKPVGLGEVFDGQIAVMDVYSAQAVFNRGRNFDRVDIMTEADASVESVQKALRQQLSSGIDIDRPEARSRGLDSSVAAMTVGMTITSFIALMVGVFIIFNCFTISVNQRWKEIGVLRSLGVERGNISRMFLAEAFIMGIIGTLLGLGLGFVLAKGVSQFMGVLVAKIYSQVSTPVPPVFRWDYAAFAFTIGLFSSLFAAWWPARMAAQLNVVMALHNIEIRDQEKIVGWTRLVIGILLVITGLLLIRFATIGVMLAFQFSYALIMIIGFVLILPKLSAWTAIALRPLMDRLFGCEGVLAVDTMIRAPRRTSSTVGALMVGLMFVFSTGAYVDSLKGSFISTMDRTINADYFITTSENVRNRSYHFTEAVSASISALPEVKRVENVRFTFISYNGDTSALISLEFDNWFKRAINPIDEGDETLAKAQLPKGDAFMISKNFAARWGTKLGDRIRVETPKGPLERPVVAIIQDFSSEKGVLFMERSLYKEYWQDTAIDIIDVNVKDGVDRAAFKAQLQKMLTTEHRAFIYTNQEYKQHAINLIDGFFLLNYMQMVIAVFVAAIGIFNTLVISVSERKREIGILRAIGGMRMQVGKMVLLESVAMAISGIIAGALAGTCNTYFLVKTAAMTMGGLTLPFQLPIRFILISLPIVFIVALVAAWWPARKAVNLKVIEAIGYE